MRGHYSAQNRFQKLLCNYNIVQLADLAEIARYLGLTPTVDPDAIQVRQFWSSRLRAFFVFYFVWLAT
jgi:hypothetical protein